VDQNLGLGFVCASISVFGFGTNFIPVKKYEMGDGMFFQLTQALGIFTVGIVVQIIRGYHSVFRPYAMVGGFIWSTGNCLSTPIIQCIGMALGLLIWSAVNMITGWCMGEWGLFGVTKSPPLAYPYLNIVGAILALVATSIYFFVKPVEEEENVPKSTGSQEGYKQLLSSEVPTVAVAAGSEADTGIDKSISESTSKRIRKVSSYETFQGTEQESMQTRMEVVNSISDPVVKYEQTAQILAGASWVDGLKQKRLIGSIMAIVAGVLYGTNMAPPTHLIGDQTHIDGNGLAYSPNGIDYVFSHFTGIIITSLMWFLCYCAVKGNHPQVNNQVILPGWVSGVVWGIAQACWFIANDNLGITVAYPIITTGPGIVASLWGVCVFGEVKGKRNLGVLMAAFFLSFVAVALITLSKTLKHSNE